MPHVRSLPWSDPGGDPDAPLHHQPVFQRSEDQAADGTEGWAQCLERDLDDPLTFVRHRMLSMARG